MTEYEQHTCPICHRTVMWRLDEFQPTPSESNRMNGYDYIRCQHCGRWYLDANDCCPHCNMPYCGGE